MCHSGREFAQGIEPRHLAEPQQFFGTLPRDALAQQGAGPGKHHTGRDRPCGHQAPGQFPPGHDALGHEFE